MKRRSLSILASRAGANAIAVSCPLCQANLDGRQRQIEEAYKTRYGIPIILYYPADGPCLRCLSQRGGIQKLITSPREALGSVGLM